MERFSFEFYLVCVCCHSVKDLHRQGRFIDGAEPKAGGWNRIQFPVDDLESFYKKLKDKGLGPFWQVAALVPNLYGLQEFAYDVNNKAPTWHSEIKVIKGVMPIPSQHGVGIQYDEKIWKSSEKII